MSGIRVANAPLSYGAFEMTVGTAFPVPDPEHVLAAIGRAGYAGTDLGPPGYLGEGAALAQRLDANELELVGGFVPLAFSERERWEEGMAGLHHTLDLFAAAGAAGARPVLCDAGGPDRIANPGRGGEDASLRLDGARWRTLVDGVARAADAARGRGFEPVFHHHTSTYVEGVGGDRAPARGLRRRRCCSTAATSPSRAATRSARSTTWGERIGAVHVKDVRLDVLETVKAERADTLTAWRRGLFCALGEGDVDLDGFFAALGERRLRRLGRGRAGPRARGRRRVRRRRRRAGAQPRVAEGARWMVTLRRDHDGPDRRGRLPAADRRLAARGRPRSASTSAAAPTNVAVAAARYGRRTAVDHAHGRRPVRRVPARRAEGLRRRRPLRHAGAPACRRR